VGRLTVLCAVLVAVVACTANLDTDTGVLLVQQAVSPLPTPYPPTIMTVNGVMADELQGYVIIGWEVVQQPTGSNVHILKRGEVDWTILMDWPGVYVFQPSARSPGGMLLDTERFTVTVALPSVVETPTSTWDTRTPVAGVHNG